MGVQDHSSREERLLWLRVCTAGPRQCGTLVSAGLSCLLGLCGVSGKGLGSMSLLLTYSGPQTSLGRWGEPSSGTAGRSCCWAHGRRITEPENLGRRSGTDTGGIKAERLRLFCFMLRILPELLRHRFCCCLPGGGHCPLSPGSTAMAVWPGTPSCPQTPASFCHVPFPWRPSGPSALSQMSPVQ